MENLNFGTPVRVEKPGKYFNCYGWITDWQTINGRIYYNVYLTIDANFIGCVKSIIWAQSNECKLLESDEIIKYRNFYK